MSARAAVAYVDILPDWKGFDRKVVAHGPAMRRQMGKIGGDLGASLTHGATAAVKVGAVGVAGAAVFALKKASDFEGQLSSLDATADLTGKQLDRMRKQALKAGGDTKFSALEAAAAQTELAKGGLSVAKIMRGGLKASLALAAAGQMDLADAGETTVNVMKLFKVRGKDAMKIADGLATAANSTTADVSDFALAFKQGGSAAKTAGLDFKETTSILEALAEGGVKGSDAGTSMKAMLVQLASPTGDAAAKAKELGLSFFDAQGNMKGVADLSGHLRDKLGNLNAQQRLDAATTLVGTDGMRALLALYDAGPRKIGRFQTELGKQGTAAQVAKKKQDNLKGSLEQLSGSVETLGISVGTAAIPLVREFSDDLTGLANKITSIVERDDLDLGEKLNRILDAAEVDAKPWFDKLKAEIDKADIPEHIGEAVSAATPKVVEAMAAAGPKAAEAFIETFVASNLWGQLVIGGLLWKKMGGGAAWGALGTKAGKNMAPGVAAGAATGAAANVGKGKVAATAAGAAGGSAVAKIASKVAGGVPPVLKAAAITPAAILLIKTWSDFIKDKSDLGLLNQYAGALERVSKAGDAGGMKKLAAQMRETAQANNDLTQGRHLNRFADALDQTAKDGGTDLTLLKQAFKTMAKSSGGDLERLRGEFAKLGDGAPASVSEIRAATSDVRRLFKHMAGDGKADMEHIRNAVRINAGRIKKTLGDDTREGKDALKLNFDLAERAIRRSMKAGTIATDEGLAQIRKLFIKSLQLYGFSPEQAQISARGRDPVSGQLKIPKKDRGHRVAQRGGVMLGGEPAGDSIPALLERGEYVLNRQAVKHVGRDQLDKLNFGAAPRFQTGGMVHVPGDPAGPYGDSVSQAVAAIAAMIVRRFHANITAGYDPGGRHKSPGHNVTGTAIDIVPGAGGNWDLIGDAVAWAAGRGMTVYYDGSRGSTALANHGPGNHAHLELGTGSAGPLADPDIKRVLLDGPDSPLKTIAQGAVDQARDAAKSRLQSLVSSMLGTGGEGTEGFAGAMTGNGADLMRRISKQRGWNFADWWEVDGRETSHGRNLVNPSSGAINRAQFLGSNVGAYGPGSVPGAPMAQQIQSMADYIADRYGNPTAARAFHDAHNWYAKGGLVGVAKQHSAGLPKGTAAPRPTGDLSKRIGQTLKTMRTGKRRGRRLAMGALLDKIDGIGLPDVLQHNLKQLAENANIFGEYGDRAGQLTDTDAITTALEGELTRRQGLGLTFPDADQQKLVESMLPRINGKTQIEWLGAQLEALFRWRNTIIQAEQVVVAKREETTRLIEEARSRLTEVQTQIARATKHRKALAKRLKEAEKHPKRNAGQIKLFRAQIRGLDEHIGIRGRLGDALKEKILPALTGKRTSLNAFRGNLLTRLDDVQGIGSPTNLMAALPAIGVLGGQILDKQVSIRDLGANMPRVTDTPGDTSSSESDSERASLLEQLLREANLRTAVSEAHFAEFKRTDSLPPYGGSFDTGGTVPGPVGAARTIIAHGGETVTPPGEGGTRVRVIVEDHRTRVIVDDVEQIVENTLRRTARAGGRRLPGQAGVMG